jgi:hypothetical protein
MAQAQLSEKEKGIGLLFFSGLLAAGAALSYGTVQAVKAIGGGKRSLVVHRTRQVPWFSKGKAMGMRTEVVDSPAELALRGSQKLGRKDVIPLNVWTLATVIASEAGSGPEMAKAAIAHAVMNAARRKGISVFKLIAPDGKFGGQQGRYAASGKPPTETDVKIAEAVYTGKIKDPTRGADQWDSPRAQRALVARKVSGYRKGPEQVAADRIKAGKAVVYVPGVDPEYLRLWRPASALAGLVDQLAGVTWISDGWEDNERALAA